VPSTIEGIVDWNNGPIFGKFTPNIKKNIKLVVRPRSSIYIGLSEEIAIKANMSIEEGIFYESLYDKIKIDNNHYYEFNLPYRTKDFPFYIKHLYNPKTANNNFIKNYYDLVGPLLNYTWGVEIETSKGRLPIKDCIDTNLFPLRDGSISGIEYTTPVIDSFNSFYTLKEGLDKLKLTGHKINEQCSLHVHVGGIKEEEISFLYSVLINIEKRIYEIFPPTYIKTSIFKRRDYNNPLKRFPEINNQVIFDYLANATIKYGFYSSHPRDPHNDRKWEISDRYKIVNFIPYFFSENKTVEFRIHTPTLNFDKILLWIMFINSILYWVRHNKQLPDSISQIINYCYKSEISNKLIKYLLLRKKWYKKVNRDKYGVNEIYLDNRFSISKL